MEHVEPFRESLTYTLQALLSGIRERGRIVDIGARSGMSASVISRVVSGTSSLENALRTADILRIQHHFTVTNGVLTYIIEPLNEIVKRCMVPTFTLVSKRRIK